MRGRIPDPPHRPLIKMAMYYDFTVPVPKATGKISRQNSGGRIYIHYILERTYDPEKKHTKPVRTCIGRLAEDGVTMHPNEKFFEFFPDAPVPERERRRREAEVIAEALSASGKSLEEVLAFLKS